MHESLYLFDSISTGVSEQKFDELMIYPIPASSNLYIGNKEPLTITVLDITGKQLLLKTGANIMFDISELKDGMYIIMINKDNRIYKRKIIKQAY